MLNHKKVSIPHELEVCPNCNASRMCRVDATVNGWLPMSRREQRRARKAAKNLAMYKTAGRRPWSDGYQSDRLGDGCEWYSTRCTEARMAHLREPSGFVAISRLADGLRKSGAIKSVQQLSDEIWSGII